MFSIVCGADAGGIAAAKSGLDLLIVVMNAASCSKGREPSAIG